VFPAIVIWVLPVETGALMATADPITVGFPMFDFFPVVEVVKECRETFLYQDPTQCQTLDKEGKIDGLAQ
jgi:hypothetical protein